MGHVVHPGFIGWQTSAPNSIIASLNRAEFPEGRRESMSIWTFLCVAGLRILSFNAKSLVITLLTLPSTTP